MADDASEKLRQAEPEQPSLGARKSDHLSLDGDTLDFKEPNSQVDTQGPVSTAGDATADFPSTSAEPNAATQDFSLSQGATTDFRAHSKSRPGGIPEKVGLYRIQKILGRGGMGIVYKAQHEKLDRTVALKMVLAGAHASTEQLNRFIAEAKAVAHLQHPNIVQIFEVGEEAGLPYFSLEYVDGESLDKVLAGKPIAPHDAADLTITLCRAMQYAHDHGVLHRDLKPANVLRSQEGVPKITDFGLAKRLEDSDDSASTRTGTIMGTPSYMSPEQARGSTHEIGAASDQYSLGAMLYEFMTGRPPFLAAKPIDTILKVRSEDPVAPRQLLSSLPADLETICLKALQKDPQKRYGSCHELAADLNRFVRGEPIHARPVGRFERAWRWCKRNPIVATLSTAAALSLVLVAVVSLWSAYALRNKNTELASVNSALNTANTDLKNKNVELDASNQENVRRTERLQSYVQDVFRDVNQLNVTEVPGIRGFKENVLTKTLPLLEEIIRELPEGSQGVPTKINALLELGKSYRDQSLGDEAERSVRDAIRLARERVDFQQGSDASRSNLCLGLKDLSAIQADVQRDILGSRESLNEALTIAEDVLAHPKVAPNGLGGFPKYRSQYLVSDMLHLLGVSNYRLGDSVKAVELYERSMQIRQEAIASIKDKSAFATMEKPPNENEQKLILRDAMNASNISKLAYAAALSRCGRSLEAEPILRATYEQTEQQLKNDESNPLRIRTVVGSAGTFGEFLAWNNRLKEGGPLLRRAAELSDKMLEKNPESMELRRAAGTAYHRYAQWLAHVGNEDHVVWGKKGLDLRQRSAEIESKSQRRQLDWMLSLSRYGEIEKSIEIADRFMEKPQKDTELLSELAQVYAQCAARTEEAALKQALIQKAIDALVAAQRLGFKDSVFLKSEIDYQPLRDLPEFQKLQ